MSKEAKLFYVNYEFTDTPVNGLENWTEDHIVELLDEYHKHKIKEVNTQDILKGFLDDFGIDKNGAAAKGAHVISFNWFAKVTTLKELSEICVRVTQKVLKSKL